MKKLFSILAIAFCLVLSNNAKAQATVSWPAGAMTTTAKTLTTKTTPITLAQTNVCQLFTLTHDTSVVITFNVDSKVKAGAIAYFKVVNGATGATRTITGGTKCTMASYTMTSAKSHMLTFVYDGTNFINTDVIKIN